MAKAAVDRDIVFYPAEDHMGEHELQTWLAMTLWRLVYRYLASKGRGVRSGHDQFFYWKKGDPTQRLAPDVYVLDVPGPDDFVGVWKLWEGPYAPAFAVEIVGDDFHNDYDDAPVSYALMKTRELVLYDPWANERSRKRVRWQVYRRDVEGSLVLVETSGGATVYSEVLGCWLRRVVDSNGKPMVRLALDADGHELFASEDEALDSAIELAEREREKAEREREKAERLAAKLRALGIDPDAE
jgi:hypothetical protein